KPGLKPILGWHTPMSGKRIVLAASRTESNERDQDCWVQMLYATLPSKVAHYVTDLNCLRNELREDGQARYVPNGLPVVESILQREFSPKEIAVCYVDQLETASVRVFKKYMPGKEYPFRPEQWPDVVLKGMEIQNRNNWFPFCTWIVGLPGE